MNLGDLTNLVEKPFAAVSNIINTPNSAGRYRPFYLRNLLDAVRGRTLGDAVEGKTVLITGGSSGIGEAAAKKIAEAGGVVVLVARTRENLEKVADQIRGDGGTAHIYPCDLSDMDAMDDYANGAQDVPCREEFEFQITDSTAATDLERLNPGKGEPDVFARVSRPGLGSLAASAEDLR